MTHSGHTTGPLGPHRECWDLLPWVVNESANPKDLARIEPHLHGCAECQQELEFQRELRDAIRAEEPIVLAPQISLQKLMQRIEGVEEVTAERAQDECPLPPLPRDAGEGTGGGTRARRWSQWLPIAACIQGVAIAGLLAALWMQAHENLTSPRFTTLTSQSSVAHGAVIRVVFASDMALDEMSDVLRSIDAQIVAGPSEAGVYTLGFNGERISPTAVDEALARLRSDGRVVFAESAVARTESQ